MMGEKARICVGSVLFYPIKNDDQLAIFSLSDLFLDKNITLDY